MQQRQRKSTKATEENAAGQLAEAKEKQNRLLKTGS